MNELLAHTIGAGTVMGERVIVDDDGLHLLRVDRRKGRLTETRPPVSARRVSWKIEGTRQRQVVDFQETLENLPVLPTHVARRLRGNQLVESVEVRQDCLNVLKYCTLTEKKIIFLVFFRCWKVEKVAIRLKIVDGREVRRQLAAALARVSEGFRRK